MTEGNTFVSAGAAGIFLAPVMQLSTNAFKAVIDIDLIGTWNALKATLPHLLVSAAKHKMDGKAGKCWHSDYVCQKN